MSEVYSGFIEEVISLKSIIVDAYSVILKIASLLSRTFAVPSYILVLSYSVLGW
jgi:hypothetical protein